MTAAILAAAFGGILLCWRPDRWAYAIPETLLLLTGGVFLVREKGLPWHPAIALLAGVALWGPIQVLTGTTIYAHDTWLWSVHWLANLVALALAFHLARTRGEALQNAVLWFGATVAFAGTLQLFTSDGKVFWLFESGYRDLVIGPFVYRNQFAAFVELVFPIALTRCLFDSSQRFICALVSAFLFASVIASGSRAGTLLVTGELMALLVLAALTGGAATRRALLVFAAALAATVAAIGPGFFWDRLASDFSGGRLDFWASSWDMIRDRPWMGFGLGNWPLAYPGYARMDTGLFANQAHSDWIEWAAEGGLPFVAMLAAFAVLTAGPAVRSRWGIGVLAFWLHCAVDYPTRRPAIGIFFFLFVGMVLASRGIMKVWTPFPFTPSPEPTIPTERR